MKALYFDGALSLREVPQPEPRPCEVLVRVLLAGICRTDLEVLKGYHAFRGIMGHEFVGEVAAPADSPWLGRRVVGEINVACRRCRRCRANLADHCLERQVLGLLGRDGAFAPYLTLPEANLHAVPDEVPDDAAVFTEPLAAALSVLETGVVTPGGRVLVVGDGKLGLLTSGVLALSGAEVHLAGHHAAHLRLAESYGVFACLEAELQERDFPVVVEASGSPGGLDLALARARPRGTVVMKSTYAGCYDLNPAALVVPEIRLLGSRCGPFAGALRLLRQGWIDPRPLIAARYPLSQGLEAVSRARQPGALAVLLEMPAA